MSQQLLQPLMDGLVLVGLFVWLVQLRKPPSLLRQLRGELHEHGRGFGRVRQFRMPVYSTKLPKLLVVAVVTFVVALALWWAAR